MEIKCTHGQSIHECCYAVNKDELLEADRRLAAIEKKCEELRANLENVCMMIRRLHRKHKIETLDSSFIVQCVEMANRYCPPQITRDGEQARKDEQCIKKPVKQGH